MSYTAQGIEWSGTPEGQETKKMPAKSEGNWWDGVTSFFTGVGKEVVKSQADRLKYHGAPAAPVAPATPKWVMPAAIGGGVLLAVLLLKKK